MQLCVPFRIVLRVGVEVEDADADAEADVLRQPRTILETFIVGGKLVAHRVTVRGRGRSDAGGGRIAGWQLPRMGEFVRG
jgi:hypothetical protein